MTINDAVSRVTDTRQTPGRFPARVIFVRNFSDYIKLVNELRQVCDVTLDIAAYTKTDLVPNFSELGKEMATHSGKQILLLSIGEYLRLCIKYELSANGGGFKSIWEEIQPTGLTTKYIIPMFGCRELFDQLVPIINERQTDFVWEITETNHESEYELTVYAAQEFDGAVQADANGLKEWFDNWTTFLSDTTRSRFSVLTKRWNNASVSLGNFKVEIVDDAFGYTASLVTDGSRLRKDFGNADFWTEVAKRVRPHEQFSVTIKGILNIGHEFDPVPVLARLNSLTATEQQLFLLWYKLYPNEDYCSSIISRLTTSEEIPSALRDGIFSMSSISKTCAEERSKALSVLNLSYSDEYFAKIDKIPSQELRLSLLTYKTKEERAYAIKTVCGLLRKGVDVTAIVEMLRKDYPNLAGYLLLGGDDDISRYFNWYRKSKIINRPTTDIPCTIDFDSIGSRHKIIQEFGTGATAFWVDGLGAEWLPLLVSKLQRLTLGVTVLPKIARALLPSETEYNHKWTTADDKWDRLDKLAHSGMPDDKDYFSCIARQLEIIDEIVDHISALLIKNNRVMLTGDHGSSRLAALSFHETDNLAIPVPAGAVIRSFGRFCELPNGDDVQVTPSMEVVTTFNHTKGRDMKCVVMKTYEHFKQSGNAAGGNSDNNAVAGEVHGGMTAEEYLVPVIVVARKKTLPKKTIPVNPKGIDKNDLGI
ncbi:hypothetical protein FACS189490_11790 [Clostridia bacterium]|nr:hypothetical protein FACS189490_11790 [Clostridia bacterium]